MCRRRKIISIVDEFALTKASLVMSTSQHRDALAAFEGNDSFAAGLHSKIASYQKKQQQHFTVETDCYDWIHAQRNLSDAEGAVTKQIIQSCSRVLEVVHKEDGYKDQCIDSKSGADAIESLKDVIAAVQMPTQHVNFEQRPGLSQVLRYVSRLKEQSTSVGKVNELTATSLSDLRAIIASSLDDIDRMCAVLSDEIVQHKREIMSLPSNDEPVRMQLPTSISRALDSLRTLLTEHHADDDGEIDGLEQCLREKFERVHTEYKCILDTESSTAPPCWDEKSQLIFKKLTTSSNDLRSSSCLLDRLKKELPGKSEREIIEYIECRKVQKANKQRAEAAAGDLKRKCRSLESEGLKEIEKLLDDFNALLKTNSGHIENESKRKELQLRLKAMRIDREVIQKTNADREMQALSKKVGEDCRKELQRANLMLKNKQAIIQHQTQQFAEIQKENCTNELKSNFTVEIESLKRQHSNRQRSIFRETQITNKLLEQKKAEEEASAAEKARLEKLNNLATNVPYYNSIMERSSDIHKTTQARKNDVYGGRSKLADFQCGNLKGFSNERIFSDAKFR